MQTNDMRCDRHLLQNHAPATFAHFDPLSARQNSPIFGAAVAVIALTRPTFTMAERCMRTNLSDRVGERVA